MPAVRPSAPAPSRSSRGPRVVASPRRVDRWALVAITAAAMALRLQHLQYGYLHAVIDYDGGVYFGSSLQLLEGHLPYRDYVFVHPPAITVLLAPLALLAKVFGTAQAFGLAKIATGLAGAASAPLAARLLWHRGRWPALTAAAVLALHPDSVTAAYGVLLEPWVVLFALLGATLVLQHGRITDGRRFWWGAALLGIACATKIWALVPVLVLVLVCLPDVRRAARVAAGALAGFALVAVPFAVLAPGAFVHEVFLDQLLRSSPVRTPVTYRLLHLLSVSPPNATLPSSGRGLLLAGAAVLAAVLALGSLVLLRRGDALERFAAGSALATTVMMLAPDTFYWHYAAFTAPFLALVAALLLARLRGHGRRAVAGLLALCTVGLTITMVHRDLRGYRLRDDHAVLARYTQAGSCVVTSVGTSTITSDRYLAGDSCPAIVDPFGIALTYGDGVAPSARTLRDPRVQALWLHAFRRADYVYLVRRATLTVPTSGVAVRYLDRHFHRIPGVGPGAILYGRN